MSLLRRRRRGATSSGAAASKQDLAHLAQFAATRPRVDAYLEPQTYVTPTTLVLVAATGEWTRRRVGGPAAAQAFGKKHGIPVYDVALVGYPQRMRDWTARRRAAGDLGPPGREGPSV